MPAVHNLCSQIANSFRAGRPRIAVPETNTNRSIVQILYKEGFIGAVMSGDVMGPYRHGAEIIATPDNVSRRRIWLDLKYREGEPVLRKIKVVSKPSRKVFATIDELKAVAAARRPQSNLLKPQEVGQITVVKTVFGIMELREALKKSVGGEVLLIAS
ncbi:hypothetical protein HK101_001434 [Irineochytrium annulatum]|nr:hypothetical protein HK101_001434 [Irineochytrium annulatum]